MTEAVTQAVDKTYFLIDSIIAAGLPVWGVASICCDYVEPLDLFFERNFLMCMWMRKWTTNSSIYWNPEELKKFDLKAPLMKRYVDMLAREYNVTLTPENWSFTVCSLLSSAVCVGPHGLCHRASCYTQVSRPCTCGSPVLPSAVIKISS